LHCTCLPACASTAGTILDYSTGFTCLHRHCCRLPACRAWVPAHLGTRFFLLCYSSFAFWAYYLYLLVTLPLLPYTLPYRCRNWVVRFTAYAAVEQRLPPHLPACHLPAWNLPGYRVLASAVSADLRLRLRCRLMGAACLLPVRCRLPATCLPATGFSASSAAPRTSWVPACLGCLPAGITFAIVPHQVLLHFHSGTRISCTAACLGHLVLHLSADATIPATGFPPPPGRLFCLGAFTCLQCVPPHCLPAPALLPPPACTTCTSACSLPLCGTPA